MTLALASIGKDGIVMATDSANAIVEDGKVASIVSAKKLYKLGNCAGLAVMSRQSGVSNWIIRRFEPAMRDKGLNVLQLDFDRLVDEFTSFAKNFSSVYTRDIQVGALRDRHMEMAFILCGYSTQGEASIVQSISTNIPNVFEPDDVPNKRCYLGFRDESIYWVRKLEEAGINLSCLSIATLKYLCSFLVYETADRNPNFVRSPVQMLTISQNGDIVIVPSDEISSIADNTKGLSVIHKIKRAMLKMEKSHG